jgi:hypothetical protein
MNKQLLETLFNRNIGTQVPPIKPDLVGEYFLLEFVKTLLPPQQKEFVSMAWSINPYEVSYTLYKLNKNFPNHSSLTILDVPPTNASYLYWWIVSRVQLLTDSKSKGSRKKYWSQLITAYNTCQNNLKIQEEVARACAISIKRFDVKEIFDESEHAWNILQSLYGQNSLSSKVAEYVGMGAMFAIYSFGEQHRKQEMEEAWLMLQNLQYRYPDIPSLKLFYCVGGDVMIIHNALIITKNMPGKVDRLQNSEKKSKEELLTLLDSISKTAKTMLNEHEKFLDQLKAKTYPSPDYYTICGDKKEAKKNLEEYLKR